MYMQQYYCEQSERRLTELVWKLRELVDVFTRVSAVGNAEAEVEVEVLEEPTLEVVSLDHPKAVDGPVAHRELHAGVRTHKQQRGEKHGAERPPGAERFWFCSLTLHQLCAV